MKNPKGKRRFEDALSELESLVAELEGGDADLDRALELFEKGVGLAAECRTRLSEAEERLKKLEAEAAKDSPES